MIPAGFVHELLSRTDVAEVVGRHVELRKAGINLKGLCPFHGEKSPSFIVSPSRQTYHCFGCGVHGDALRFLMEHTGVGFTEAVADLAQQVGLKVPQDERTDQQREQAAQAQGLQRDLHGTLDKAAQHYRQQLKLNPRAVAYLKGRGLSGEVAARFGMGYAPEGWRGLASVFPAYDDPKLVEAGLVILQDDAEEAKGRRYDRFRDRIMFPIRSVRGDVIGFGGRVLDQGEPKYLNSPETPVFVKGRELYGLFEARTALRQRGHVLVVEGYMDVVALAQHGFANAVATLGTACTAEHVQKLFRFTDAVVFSFDGDAAGRRAARRALDAALPHATDLRSIRFLFLPSEHDPDSYVREHGSQAFDGLVQHATPLSAMLLEAAREGADLATPEGRARMLAQARPLVEQLPPGLLREQVLAEVARAGAMDASALSAAWHSATGASASTRTPSRGPNQGTAEPTAAGRLRFSPARTSIRPRLRATTTLLDRAAWLLLGDVAAWDVLGASAQELLAGQAPPHGSLFAWIERTLHEHGALGRAGLLSLLAADASAEDLRSLTGRLAELHELDADIDVRAELQTVLHRLQMQAVNEEINLLLESGEQSPAVAQRHRELVALQRELATRSAVASK